ncbi:stage II sporulation protein P [Aneurinibacillus thermoaerophilus]|uniref:stage II sporulation protein P n=1 Tax=Aneurinibacillus thermoaerophilus TaxID=143495 RepID=UPI002E1E7BA8|nr:stage II sporulation protein P [Aneurinibacillus thermoaerophilus]MED0735810.1 stage II sporulation protein P [Aneurinibacillus thermoaerophilus]MED0763966.1 stage II sporulation protein P [Aneurinibacillus thermoaerophilus]
MYRRYRGFVVNLYGAGMQRSFVILSLGTAVIFIFMGILFVSQADRRLSSQHIGKMTVTMSNSVLLHTMGYEIPYFKTMAKHGENIDVSSLAFRLVTSINLKDPRSFLGNELPGFSLYDTEVLVSGKELALSELPFESSPPPEALKDAPGEVREATSEKEAPPNGEPLSTNGQKVFFIYNTHNRESWVHAVPKARKQNDPNLAMDSKVNVTLISKRLAQSLEKNGIGSSVGKTDFTGRLIDRHASYALSYAESLKTVKEVMTENRSLNYFIDIHRDSLRRDSTTVKINGKTYAQLHFVIGMRNKNWEKNQQFALKIHNAVEKKYPGLSKGIFGKKGGNGEYNQSVSPNAILIEVGGVDNTLEECYRTADALGDAIAEIYWEAEKVNAKKKPKQS